ncbi:MAG TPA: hypothetical protein VLH35_00505 [Candidatus Acidoferrales bacterium]|nr:hypothetical protein [Candidatus Acidoferrales bacterium]
MLLKTSKTGVKFRLKLLGTRWLKWKQAIIASFIQFGIAFLASYVIQDYFTKIFTQNTIYLLPILLSTIGFIYAYIYGLSPYKKAPERFAPSIIFIAIAILLFLGIWYFTQNPFYL